MATQALPPFAPAFVESMRSLGYSLESAIADLVDNSITALAQNVSIHFREGANPYIALLDDGQGMSEYELVAAMRHGAKNPLDARGITDLGRFGVGLKTASLSQCRNLTVVSLQKSDRHPCSRTWDIDLINKHGDWILFAPDTDDEILALPHVEDLLRQGHGTLVLWRELDRVIESEHDIAHAFQEKMPRVRAHLELTFHRFLHPDDGELPLRIAMNADQIRSIDPFLRGNSATQRLPPESIMIGGEQIMVQPFVLPHVSRLRKEDVAMLASGSELKLDQGFYIYRNRRLLVHGTWFRMVRPDELTKLARVQVDIPNTLDHLWAIDIRKQQALAPVEVRTQLRRIIGKIADTSRRVYKFRGRATGRSELIHVWKRIEGREGIYYEINRDHPLLEAMKSHLEMGVNGQLELIIRVLEQNLPVNDIYLDMAGSKQVENDQDVTRAKLREQLAPLISSLQSLPDRGRAVLAALVNVEPFSRDPELALELAKEMIHE